MMDGFIGTSETTMNPAEAPRTVEPAKAILENMDEILKELGSELNRIDTAIFSPKLTDKDNREPMDECLLGMLNRQRNTAEELLHLAMHIREGLW